MTIAAWHDIENNVASEVHVKRFKSKEVEREKKQETYIFSCADGFYKQKKSRTTSNGGSTVHFGRSEGYLLQSARGESLQEEGGVAVVSDADRDAMEARVISGVCLLN